MDPDQTRFTAALQEVPGGAAPSYLQSQTVALPPPSSADSSLSPGSSGGAPPSPAPDAGAPPDDFSANPSVAGPPPKATNNKAVGKWIAIALAVGVAVLVVLFLVFRRKAPSGAAVVPEVHVNPTIEIDFPDCYRPWRSSRSPRPSRRRRKHDGDDDDPEHTKGTTIEGGRGDVKYYVDDDGSEGGAPDSAAPTQPPPPDSAAPPTTPPNYADEKSPPCEFPDQKRKVAKTNVPARQAMQSSATRGSVVVPSGTGVAYTTQSDRRPRANNSNLDLATMVAPYSGPYAFGQYAVGAL